MKKSTFLLVAGLFSFLIGANAQQSPQRTCNVFEMQEAHFQQDPSARARYAQVQGMIDQYLRTNPQARTQAIINVPVVVHVMLPSAQQAQVTDAIIQGQIDTLNFYYGASPFNTDSLRVYTPFRTTYGRSEIRFCLAKRTPTNTITNGITRTVTSTIYDGSNVPGNVIVWDPTKYLNVWVVNGGTSGLLGYSYTPGTWAPADPHQGFVNDYRAFGAGPGTSSGGYHFNEYNGGKTAVHEIGHYFNLAHTWGPNNSGNPACNLSDFCADTPPCDGPFFGCPSSFPVLDNCSAAAPGVMWQNHMDYADDRCMILFTADQCARMMAAITTAPDRTGLISSNGCTPIVAATNDLSVSVILNPVTSSTVACVPIIPRVTVTNLGTNSVTGFNVNVRLNGSVVGTQTFAATTLASGASTDLTLNLVPISPAIGTHTLKIHTTDPNLVADAVPTNDTATSVFTRNNGATVPIVEGFESATYPPTGWTLNPSSGSRWQRTTPGAASANSIYGDFFDYSSGTTINIISPVINVAGLPGVGVSFDLAHKQWSATLIDRLQVDISTDCGNTFSTVVYDKTSSTGLATIPALGSPEYSNPAAADWRKESIQLPASALSTGILMVRFRGISGFGNNIFIDNINIDKQFDRDLTVTTINRPVGNECGPFAPQAIVKNVGVQTITSYNVTYSIDGGPLTTFTVNTSLASNATATITLPVTPTLAAGNHSINICTAAPVSASGTGDQNTANDCLAKAFTSKPVVNTPLVEGFEGTTFPSANWSIINPNNNVTWEKRGGGVGYGSDNAAFIDHFNFITIGQADNIESPAFPLLGVGGVLADSVVVTWDLAHRNYPGAFDEFAVIASSDCGNSFATILFNESGATLAGAAGSSTADFTAPTQAQYRHLRRAVGGAPLANGSMIMRFRTINDFGNNIFLDNINIQALFKRDLKVESIDKPLSVECTGSFTPQATVRNVGIETITGFTLTYRLDNGTPQTTTVTGVTLVRDATMQVNLLPAIANLGTGQHSIRVYSAAPITVSGTGDQLTTNDTLTKGFGITGTVQAPLVEAFEGATFPPAGWAVGNPDALITWNKSTAGARNSAGSAFMNNYSYSVPGRKDELYSPVVTYTGVDSVTLSFDIAAATKNYPGTTGIGLDTLEVLVTKDCGNTFTSIWKKWGEDLQTINDPNYPQTLEFIPGAAYQWRNEQVDLTTLGFIPNGPVQLVFRNTNNFENNIFLDNVNLTTRTLPNTLKEQGYMILPNPFNDQFTIWHLTTPTNLRFVSIYNSAGQLVWKKQFNGDATKHITVDLTSKPAGTYIVNLGYSDRVRDTQVKVVKAQ